MPLSKRVRFETLKRDGFTCQYCGKKPPEVILHIDHIVARVDGGTDDLENLITSCADCNLGKGVTRLVAVTPCVMCGDDRAGNWFPVPRGLGTFEAPSRYEGLTNTMGLVCAHCIESAVWQLGCLIRPLYYECAGCSGQWESDDPIELHPDTIVAGGQAWVCPTCANQDFTGGYQGEPNLRRRARREET